MKEIQILKALSDPTRYKIIIDLLDSKDNCCTDFAKLTHRDLSTISRQLEILKDSGLIEVNRIKKTKCIKLKNKKNILALLKLLKKI
jgi:DNA-binding transcriptional ArsR family regulator